MKELIVIEEFNAVQIFDGEHLDPLLERITEQVKGFVSDTSTAKGRKEIASLANKIARSKTWLDDAGKDLVSGWKKKAKVVDVERKKMRDYLDTLKVETRQPLTEWEIVEDRKVADILLKIENFKTLSEFNDGGFGDLFPSSKLKENLSIVKSIAIDESFGDFSPQAAIAKDAAVDRLVNLIAKREAEEAEKVELERLRKEAEDRAEEDRKERIRKEGEERARLKYEAEKQAEKERAEKEAKEKAEADQKERDRVEVERQDAINARWEAERKAKEADERAVIQAGQAKLDAINARMEAKKQERDRIEAEKQADIEAAKKREADVKHKKMINNSAMDAFVLCGLEPESAKKAVVAIASGKIPYVKIGY